MHCMDADYSVFSLLPPYNTLVAQLIDPDGRLVTSAAGIELTFEAVSDPQGSINSTSAGKSNFWDHVGDLFGVELSDDQGLAGVSMPGPANQPQPMRWDADRSWFVAEGIPITPYEDSGRKNPYPLVRVVARGAGGVPLATTDVVLPVSDEMSCATCHASGTSAAARPIAGWVEDPDPERDYRLNVLRIHDDREQFRANYRDALVEAGYDPRGLYPTATEQGTSILCARCHASTALPGSGIAGIAELSHAIHRRMAFTADPDTGLPLYADENRSACYRCHPGSETRCLRGAMGRAVAADGSLAMQCQSCHGSMLDLAAADRRPWLDEPNCQSCHSGTAIGNDGELRHTSAFNEDGSIREPLDPRFATEPDQPAAGLSLFQFSRGHGGLACSGCHGSTHAELPSTHLNDNLQSIALQGHVGTLAECATCHGGSPRTVSGGPHGLHPLGQVWVDDHGDAVEDHGGEACRTCHGADYRGTELSRTQADRNLVTRFGAKEMWRGFQVGCYGCHRGPGDDDPNPNRSPVVADVDLRGSAIPEQVLLTASDADGDALSLRIVSQPAHGRVGVEGNRARIYVDPGFSGEDAFTYAAWDGSIDSNLGTVRFSAAGACPADCDGDGSVTVDEILRAVNIALGEIAVEACPAADPGGDGQVTVDEIIAAVDAALRGCFEPG